MTGDPAPAIRTAYDERYSDIERIETIGSDTRFHRGFGETGTRVELVDFGSQSTSDSTDCAEGSSDYGTVIGHADFVLLSDVEFVVQEAGQEQARESGVKNVHAVVRGTVEGIGADGEVEWNMMVRMFGNDVCNVTYDPFESDHFEVEGVPRVEEHDVAIGDPIYSAEYASVSEAGVGAMLRSLS